MNSRNWQARLSLHYQQQNAKTILAKREHYGPLLVQKPFYPEKTGCCHTYIIHPPGGIVGGDHLEIDVHCESGSHALLTTPAATKFYRTNGECAIASQQFHVAADARLEWLPQETVYFDGSSVDNHTLIHLAKGSSLFAWDIQCLGLPASNSPFHTGSCIQKLSIFYEKRPLLLECNRLIGGSKLLTNRTGMQSLQALGTLVASCSDEHIIDRLRQLKALKDKSLLIGFTRLNGLLVCRILAAFSYQILAAFKLIWTHARPVLLGTDAIEPRIWRT